MPELPTGTVTLLFTNIEGSTTRWEQQRAAMQTALARHDAILREAIAAYGGYVFKTVGDAFCATFATAPDAVAAAIAGQHVLYAEPRDEEVGQLRVRIALHTGVAEGRDGDYFGPVVPTSVIRRRISSVRIDMINYAIRPSSPVAPAPSPTTAKKRMPRIV